MQSRVLTRPDELAPATSGFSREACDVARLLRYLVVLLLGLIAARGADLTTAGVEGDIVQLTGHLPGVVLGALIVAVQSLHLLLFLGIPLALLVTRRWRLWGIYTLGYALTSLTVAILDKALDLGQEASLVGDRVPDELRGWPPTSSVGTAVFAVVTLTPYLSRSWRRFGWLFVAVLATTRVVTADDVVLDLILAVGVGGTIASLLLIAFGRRVERPTPTAVVNALDRIGLLTASVTTADVASTSSTPFTATLVDGAQLHCKVVSSVEYEADSLARRYRSVRVRDLGEEVAYSTVRRAVAVESMLAMSARRAGARTPEVIGVSALPVTDAMVIAFEQVPGTVMSQVPPERVTDDVLDQAWTAVKALRSAGLAHRDLQLTSWILDDTDQLWLVDFSFGEPAATEGALAGDVAELLAATFAVVGAERAVASASRVLGKEALATGLAYLVPVALTKQTRAAVKGAGGMAPLIEATASECGVSDPEFAPIERVKPRSLIMAALLVLAVYVLLPQLADLPRMIESIRAADGRYAGLAALASVVTYLGSGLAIANSSPRRIRVIDSALAALAATFVGAATPPGVAHAGVNARFYTRQGMSPAVAISATAAKEVAVTTVHVVLLLLLAIVGGSSGALGDELDKLPSVKTLAIVVAVVLALLCVAFALPRVRGILRDTVLPAVRESLSSLRELASHPVRVLALFSGGLMLQLGYIAALYFSVLALGGNVGFVTIGLIYLTVGSVASVAPTPGGIGAVEAVLLAALTGVGLAAAPALAAVFLFRIMTFWAPIPLGGLSMRYLVSRDLL